MIRLLMSNVNGCLFICPTQKWTRAPTDMKRKTLLVVVIPN